MPYTRLRYHFVFSTKNRTPWITPDIEEVLYPSLHQTITGLDGKIIQPGGIEDHVHLVCAIRPKYSVSHVIGRLKSESSGVIHHAGLPEFDWSANYCAFTLDPFNMNRIIDYVRYQKQHHHHRNLQPRYERCDLRP